MFGSRSSATAKDSSFPNTCEDWYKNDLISFLSRPSFSSEMPAKDVDPSSDFEVQIDVSPYEATDIFIRTEGEYLYIEAKQEEMPEEHGYVAREFTRRYKIPNNTETENMRAARLRNGILWVNAPKKKQKSETPGVRTIPIRLQSPGFDWGYADLPAKSVAIPVTRGVRDKAKEVYLFANLMEIPITPEVQDKAKEALPGILRSAKEL